MRSFFVMERIKEQLKRHEGLRLKPYACTAGKATIGYGRNLDDVGITEAEAEAMLEHDIEVAIKELSRSFDWFGRLDEVRQDVVINMTFNLGLNGFYKFKRMIAAISRGYFDRAAIEMMDSKWAGQVKGRANELAQQMRTGRYGTH